MDYYPLKPGTTRLWRPTGAEELDLVKEARWKAWPPRLPDQPIFYPVLNEWYATKIARDWNVPHKGVGFVTFFDVSNDYLDGFDVQQAGGRDVLEYWIPAEEIDEFNAAIVGSIVEHARYSAGIDADAVAEAAAWGYPQEWLDYLSGKSWREKGDMTSGAFVWLLRPADAMAATEAWGEGATNHPGALMLGNDGASEMFMVDSRQDASPVYLVRVSSAGWSDAEIAAPSMGEFITAVDEGSFDY